MGKRKKISGLSGSDSAIALMSMRALLDKMRREKELLAQSGTAQASEGEQAEDEGVAEEFDDELFSHMEKIIDMMSNRINSRDISFSSMNANILAELGLDPASADILKLKNNIAGIVTQSMALGEDSLWSASVLHRHLELLERIVPQTNEAAARLWINAFFYRVAAMLPAEHPMVLSVEQPVPAVTLIRDGPATVSGTIDWVVMTAPPRTAERLLGSPALGKDVQALFVTEAKSLNRGPALLSHVPQALAEMCACARTAGRKVVRGALTNGHTWIFLIVKFEDKGISCSRAEPINIINLNADTQNMSVSEYAVALISSILAHWMMHSHEDLRDDDHFVVKQWS
ncbi:hypothetical protein D9619_007613 [Psilocybe cf. subviscida]|uniref:Uncharacterized protein n=1 Tax=Psilocybe cf. subviscida TaxID=2480587 RepID=A0A8H5B1J8_9AGAR|nr:hypothetical protein D9619_007613 [Psilocybe cf. subviscida]